tara:strand:+ start:28 stop:624 length:597 start_codon:yes stop_codon:yes gene_type:complete
MTIDENNVFINGEILYLKVLTSYDVDNTNWYGWFNSEDTTLHMQKHYFPNTVERQHRFLESAKNDSTKLQLGIVEKSKHALIGVVSLNNIDLINRNAEFSLLIGEKRFRNLQYAEESVFLILRHAFKSLNLHKVYGGSIETLDSWVSFLEKRFGFQREGVQKDHVFKSGKYLDIINFSIISNTFLEKFKDDKIKQSKI